MARPRKPTAVLKLAGTYRADRHGEADSVPTIPGQVTMPDLAAPAAEFWRDHVEPLIAAGVVTRGDVATAGGMATLFALYRAAADLAAKDPADQPARTATVSYWNAFSAIAARFGLDPSSREKLRVAPAAKHGVPSRDRSKAKFFSTPAS